MRTILPLLLSSILLISCSIGLDNALVNPTTAPTGPPPDAAVVTDLPTHTATISTPTFTLTPTLIGEKTRTPTSDFTATSSTFTPLPLFTPNTPTAPVAMVGFVTVFTSSPEFFKAGICEPTSVKFTAQVSNAAATAFVVLFVRFKSKQTGATSEWTSITIRTIGGGTYVHDLEADEMKAVDYFNDSWVQYQFVATDSKSREIGRTDIVTEGLSVLRCIPTPTASPIESPTKLVP